MVTERETFKALVTSADVTERLIATVNHLSTFAQDKRLRIGTILCGCGFAGVIVTASRDALHCPGCGSL